MKHTTSAPRLACAKALQGYDQLHVLSVLGAMQLIPENIHLTASLETLARVAVTLPYSARAKRRMTRDQIVALLAVYTGRLVTEPALGAFTEAVAFFGGSYTIFTATTDDLGVVLRQTLQALFLDHELLDDAEFLQEARDLLWATLILSDEVARRAGVRRNTPPPPERRDRRVVFPDEAALREAVVFEVEDLCTVLAAADLRLEVLDPLTMSQGQAMLREDELFPRPVVRVGNKRVVALPGQLLNAARHAVQRRAIERGHRAQLALLLHRAAASSVVQSVARQGAAQADFSLPNPMPGDLCSEFTFRMDTDKGLYVLLVTDTLEGFDARELFSSWTLAATAEQVTGRMAAAVAHICEAEPSLSDILCLLVVQGPLGWIDESFQPLWPPGIFGLGLSSHELETVSWLERGEPLTLWHFAMNAARVRQHGPVHLRTRLDEWAMSKIAEHGDYTLGAMHPTPLVMTAGGAARLRGEVLERWDFHGTLFDGAGSGVEVVRAGPEGAAIYTLCDTPLPVTRLVEDLPVPIWIVGLVHGNEWDERLHELYHMITGVIAFWVEAMRPDLQLPLSVVAPYLLHVTVRVLLVPADDWLFRLDGVPEQAPFRVDVKAEHGMVDLTLWSEARILFHGPDNQGERLLLGALLHGLCQMLPDGRRDCLSSPAIQDLIDRHAPLGPKKAASFLNVPKAPTLDPRGIPPYRGVQLRDELNVKAEIGRHVVGALGFPPGIVLGERCDPLMLQVVDFLFKSLAREITTLKPDGLLEWVMEQYEAIVRQKEETRLSAPSRLVCARDRTGEEQTVQQEMSDQARAAVACRFLIEYVAAQPPQGLRPISYAVYDSLLALAAQIYDWGGTRDLHFFELSAPQLVIYPFGRVDVRTDVFDQVRQRYYAVFGGHALANMEESFADHWAIDEESDFDANHPPFAEEVGDQLSDMFLLMAKMLPIGDDISPGVVCMSLDKLVSELQSSLGWDPSHIRQRIAELSVTPRFSFLEPGTHKRDQAYPWRFHRALSYLRRPLVQRERNGTTELLWGSRHITALAPYLWTSFRTQRLKDMDEQTTRLMGKAADKVGLEFNRDVAGLLATYPHFRVITGFKKVKGLQMNTDVGDVDVLVIDPIGHRILAIECKQLARADTPQELRRELDGLFSGERSRVSKHQRRIKWIQEHLPAVLAELRLDPSIEWDLVPLMVVDEELFAPHFKEPPFPVVALRDLKGWLASQGTQRHLC